MKLTKRKRVTFTLQDIKAHIAQQRTRPQTQYTLPSSQFDLSVDPYWALATSNPRTYLDPTAYPYPPSALAQPATHPPLAKLRIAIQPLPSVLLSVYVSSASYSYVSVAHLLRSLHAALQVRVSESEFAQLSEWEQKIAAKAFYDRCESSKDYYGELFEGVKRIDFFGGETRIAGLVPSSKWRDTWDVVLSRGTRKRPPQPTGQTTMGRRAGYYGKRTGS